jgi:UDP:flavonoid glycosyltransferase YjiC (YdhE family)
MTEQSYTSAARAIQTEIAAMPSPTEVVPYLEDLSNRL